MDEEMEVQELLDDLAGEKALYMSDFPESPHKLDQLKFAEKIIDEEDPKRLSKTASLKDHEVGTPKVPSLTYFNLSNFAQTEGLDKVSVYLQHKAGNLSALSLGRKAALLAATFTVRKEMRNIPVPKETTKKTWLGETTTKEGSDDV